MYSRDIRGGGFGDGSGVVDDGKTQVIVTTNRFIHQTKAFFFSL